MAGIPGMSEEEWAAFVDERVEHLVDEGLVYRVGDHLYVTDYGRCMAEEWARRGLVSRAVCGVKTVVAEILYVLFIRKHGRR